MKYKAEKNGENMVKYDETVDVIVIGSGYAGLAAAIEAKKAGHQPLSLKRVKAEAVIPPSAAGISRLPEQHFKKNQALMTHRH